MDWSVVHTLNDFLARHDVIEDPLLAYVQASEALFAGVLVLVCVLARHARWASVRRAAVAGGLSAGVALLAAKLLTEVVHRARPFVAHPAAVHLFAKHAADASFPSDHATAAFAIAVAITLRKRAWGIVPLVLATVLAFGRVALGLHYPTDVLGGAALGAVAALLLWTRVLRSRVDALADLAGRLWDGALDRLLARITPRRRSRPPNTHGS